MDTTHKLRPLALGGIIGKAFGLYARHYWSFLVVMGLFELFWVFTGGRLESSLGRAESRADEAMLASGSVRTLGLYFGVIALQLVLLTLNVFLMNNLVAPVAGPAYLGEPVDGFDAWVVTRSRLGSILGGAALVALATTLLSATVVGIPLAVYLYVRWSLAPQAMVLEGKRVLEALRRSSELVRGRWWRVAGVSLALEAVGAVLLFLVAYAANLPVEALSGDAASQGLLAGIAGAVAVVVVGAFTPIGMTVLYYDLLVRRGELGGVPAEAGGPAIGSRECSQPGFETRIGEPWEGSRLC